MTLLVASSMLAGLSFQFPKIKLQKKRNLIGLALFFTQNKTKQSTRKKYPHGSLVAV